MDTEERDRLGRVAHQAMLEYFLALGIPLNIVGNTWDDLDEAAKELYRREAEAVIVAYQAERKPPSL